MFFYVVYILILYSDMESFSDNINVYTFDVDCFLPIVIGYFDLKFRRELVYYINQFYLSLVNIFCGGCL